MNVFLICFLVSVLAFVAGYFISKRESSKEVKLAKASRDHYKRCYEVLNSTYNTFLEAFENQAAFRYNLRAAITKNIRDFQIKKEQYAKDGMMNGKFFCLGAVHALCLIRLSVSNQESNSAQE